MSIPTLSPTVHALAGLAAYEPGTITSQQLLTTPSGSATVFAFAAGEQFREHSTAHDALVVVIDGEATVTLGGAEHRVRAGEAFRLPPRAPHAVRAESAMRMLLVVLRNDLPATL